MYTEYSYWGGVYRIVRAVHRLARLYGGPFGPLSTELRTLQFLQNYNSSLHSSQLNFMTMYLGSVTLVPNYSTDLKDHFNISHNIERSKFVMRAAAESWSLRRTILKFEAPRLSAYSSRCAVPKVIGTRSWRLELQNAQYKRSTFSYSAHHEFRSLNIVTST